MPDIPLLDNINQVIINPIIGFMIALAVVWFLYGLFIFLAGLDSEDKRKEGQKHMIWGTIGLFIMISVFGIMQVVCTTVGCN
ncbi:MAG: hypothetical protein WDZ85_01405 [Candidatus Paceibacterota bacterium]